MNPDYEPLIDLEANPVKKGSIFENEFMESDQNMIVGFPENSKRTSSQAPQQQVYLPNKFNNINVQNDQDDFWNQPKPGSNSPANVYQQKRNRRRENNIMFIENEVFDNSQAQAQQPPLQTKQPQL